MNGINIFGIVLLTLATFATVGSNFKGWQRLFGLIFNTIVGICLLWR